MTKEAIAQELRELAARMIEPLGDAEIEQLVDELNADDGVPEHDYIYTVARGEYEKRR